MSGLRLMFSSAGAGLLALVLGPTLSLAETHHLPMNDRARPTKCSLQRRGTLWRHAPYRRALLLITVRAALIPLFLPALPFFGQAVHEDGS